MISKREGNQPPPHSPVPGDLDERRWETLQHELRQRWKCLTDEDILRIAGRRDALIAVLSEKEDYGFERARREVEVALRGERRA
ncbi:MAG TPA: hypothetical protein VJQ51_09040 [Burkholderiales bacterium]|nr:hypothetical protein [Burkholderiales bacterium]